MEIFEDDITMAFSSSMRPVLRVTQLPPVDDVDFSLEQRLQVASIYCNQARLGENVAFDFLSRNGVSVSNLSLRASLVFANTHWLRLCLLIVLVCLAFFERPMWCWNLESCNEKYVPIEFGNSNVSVPGILNATVILGNATDVLVQVPRSFFPLMPPMASLGVETGCLLLLLLFDSALSSLFVRWQSWLWSESLDGIKCFFYVFSLIDVLVSFGTTR